VKEGGKTRKGKGVGFRLRQVLEREGGKGQADDGSRSEEVRCANKLGLLLGL